MTKIKISQLIKSLIRKKRDLDRLQEYEQASCIRGAIEQLEKYVELVKKVDKADYSYECHVVTVHVGKK